jgi:hypothetical protein
MTCVMTGACHCGFSGLGSARSGPLFALGPGSFGIFQAVPATPSKVWNSGVLQIVGSDIFLRVFCSQSRDLETHVLCRHVDRHAYNIHMRHLSGRNSCCGMRIRYTRAYPPLYVSRFASMGIKICVGPNSRMKGVSEFPQHIVETKAF